MKSSTNRSLLSQTLAIALTLSIVCTQSLFAFGGAGRSSGEITVNATARSGEKPFVFLDGEPAFSGRTFFSGDSITTTATASATIDFGRLGRISMQPDSSLTLNIGQGTIAGTLNSGNVDVIAGEGVTVQIVTPDDTFTSDAASSSRFTVNVAAGTSLATAAAGIVRRSNGEALAAKQDDDDDDDDDGNIWVPIIVIGGAIGTVIIVSALDDDDEIVSPVR